jgi:cytochrome c
MKDLPMLKSFPLALAVLMSVSASAVADGDAAKGANVFKKCMACHLADAATNKTGPHLKGLIGRSVATAEGFPYSDSMKEFAATHPVWDEATFDTYIENPKASIPRTKMAFPGLKKPEDRANLIAFLKTKM